MRVKRPLKERYLAFQVANFLSSLSTTGFHKEIEALSVFPLSPSFPSPKFVSPSGGVSKLSYKIPCKKCILHIYMVLD